MPFVQCTKPTYWWKVKVPVRNDEKGTWDTVEFMAEFKRRTQPEVAELLKKTLPELKAEVIEKEFTGWKDYKTADGSPLEVSDVNRTTLLAEMFVEQSIFGAWWESSATGPAKN